MNKDKRHIKMLKENCFTHNKKKLLKKLWLLVQTVTTYVRQCEEREKNRETSNGTLTIQN